MMVDCIAQTSSHYITLKILQHTFSSVELECCICSQFLHLDNPLFVSTLLVCEAQATWSSSKQKFSRYFAFGFESWFNYLIYYIHNNIIAYSRERCTCKIHFVCVSTCEVQGVCFKWLIDLQHKNLTSSLGMHPRASWFTIQSGVWSRTTTLP